METLRESQVVDRLVVLAEVVKQISGFGQRSLVSLSQINKVTSWLAVQLDATLVRAKISTLNPKALADESPCECTKETHGWAPYAQWNGQKTSSARQQDRVKRKTAHFWPASAA